MSAPAPAPAGSLRLDIRYVSRFSYPESAWDSHNLLRACPTSDEHQRLLDYRLDIEPGAKVTSYVDSWGTRVDMFGVREPHHELLVVALEEVKPQIHAADEQAASRDEPDQRPRLARRRVGPIVRMIVPALGRWKFVFPGHAGLGHVCDQRWL